MSLRDIQLKDRNINVFVTEEPAPSKNSKSGGKETQDSVDLAIFLGLIEPITSRQENDPRAYRVLGFYPDSLWCESTRIIAMRPSLVDPVEPQSTNCPNTKVGVTQIDKYNPLPFVTLDYADSLLDHLQTEDDERYEILYDKPTLDARLEETWCDENRCYAKIWIKGSFKGYHKTATITFSYDPYRNEACVGHGNYKNRYIRIKGIETCWNITSNVICVSATVQWRPKPEWSAHVEVCLPLALTALKKHHESFNNTKYKKNKKCQNKD